MQIVLKRIGNKTITNPDPGFPFVRQPTFFGNEFVHQPVEVVVMGELDVAADVPKKTLLVTKRRRETASVIVRFQQLPIAVPELVKTPGGAEASGAATKYEYLHG